MRVFDGEAHGNTFSIVVCDDAAQGIAYAKVIREQKRWDFDSMLIVTEGERRRAIMAIHERDGTESRMCGNGMLTLAALVKKLGYFREVIPAHDAGAILEICSRGEDRVMVDVSRRGDFMLPYGAAESLHFVVYEVAGEPHAVALCDDVRNVPLAVLGRKIVPEANCTIVSRNIGGSFGLHARTFERGVFKETESCGTGACAAAFAMHALGMRNKNEYAVHMGRHILSVAVNADGGAVLRGNGSITNNHIRNT